MRMPLFNSKQAEVTRLDSSDNTPNHIAIIMDGNGRWARKRGMPRMAGHKQGVTAIVKIVRASVKYNVKVLTLYSFSTENWKRPKAEVDFILRLPKEFLHIYLPELHAQNVRIGVIGDMGNLPIHTREAVQYAIDHTRDNDGLQLNFALNYGSRYEILDAMKRMLADVTEGKLALAETDEDRLSSYLYTAGLSDPDLLIRTGGEKRLSNFLLWQLAYTEFWFTDVLWPDFSETEFLSALEEFQQRKRRFGGIEYDK